MRNGQRNISIGNNALEDSLDTEDNIAIGFEALQKNTEGNRNVAIGSESLKRNETGRWAGSASRRREPFLGSTFPEWKYT